MSENVITSEKIFDCIANCELQGVTTMTVGRVDNRILVAPGYNLPRYIILLFEAYVYIILSIWGLQLFKAGLALTLG